MPLVRVARPVYHLRCNHCAATSSEAGTKADLELVTTAAGWSVVKRRDGTHDARCPAHAEGRLALWVWEYQWRSMNPIGARRDERP